METAHEIFFKDSALMDAVADGSVQLVVTSPPYPMIEMWDEIFSAQNPGIEKALKSNDGEGAFEMMHNMLDAVWRECFRVLCDGGIACINIGDAVRTINKVFKLYNSHSRILRGCLGIGFQSLPSIIWRKQTNAPNKFMGSGMMPPGAYVTLEHEFVLILRKGGKREFRTKEKTNRRESAFFWEERNNWFSDVWFDLKGASQRLLDKNTRARSAAFPFELPYRLVNMFSVKGDTVLDPFLGTGMTVAAAMASERNSVGFEIDVEIGTTIDSVIQQTKELANNRIRNRLEAHVEFVKARIEKGKSVSKRNEYYGFPVVSGQEKDIILRDIEDIRKTRESDKPANQKGGAAQSNELQFAFDPEPDVQVPVGSTDKYRVSYDSRKQII